MLRKIAVVVAAVLALAGGLFATVLRRTPAPKPAPAAVVATKPPVVASPKGQKVSAARRIPVESASAIARKRVPNGVIKAHALEHKQGRLVYAFYITTTAASSIAQVDVDAVTGAVVGMRHHEQSAEVQRAP